MRDFFLPLTVRSAPYVAGRGVGWVRRRSRSTWPKTWIIPARWEQVFTLAKTPEKLAEFQIIPLRRWVCTIQLYKHKSQYKQIAWSVSLNINCIIVDWCCIIFIFYLPRVRHYYRKPLPQLFRRPLLILAFFTSGSDLISKIFNSKKNQD